MPISRRQAKTGSTDTGKGRFAAGGPGPEGKGGVPFLPPPRPGCDGGHSLDPAEQAREMQVPCDLAPGLLNLLGLLLQNTRDRVVDKQQTSPAHNSGLGRQGQCLCEPGEKGTTDEPSRATSLGGKGGGALVCPLSGHQSPSPGLHPHDLVPSPGPASASQHHQHLPLGRQRLRPSPFPRARREHLPPARGKRAAQVDCADLW